MSVTETELALAVMDDDGFGCTITSTPALPDGLSAYLAAKHAYEGPVPGSPEWNAGVPTKREAAAGLDDDSVSLTDYLRNLHVRE